MLAGARQKHWTKYSKRSLTSIKGNKHIGVKIAGRFATNNVARLVKRSVCRSSRMRTENFSIPLRNWRNNAADRPVRHCSGLLSAAIQHLHCSKERLRAGRRGWKWAKEAIQRSFSELATSKSRSKLFHSPANGFNCVEREGGGSKDERI